MDVHLDLKQEQGDHGLRYSRRIFCYFEEARGAVSGIKKNIKNIPRCGNGAQVKVAFLFLEM